MSRKHPLTYDEFQSIYSKVPRLCVEIILQTPQGILLTFRTKNGYQNQWHLPGGTVHYQEKLTDTVHRVAMEELGICVTIEKMLGYIEYPSEVEERGFGYSVGIAFLCHTQDEKFQLDEDAQKYDFFSILPENTITEQKLFLEKEYLTTKP